MIKFCKLIIFCSSIFFGAIAFASEAEVRVPAAGIDPNDSTSKSKSLEASAVLPCLDCGKAALEKPTGKQLDTLYYNIQDIRSVYKNLNHRIPDSDMQDILNSAGIKEADRRRQVYDELKASKTVKEEKPVYLQDKVDKSLRKELGLGCVSIRPRKGKVQVNCKTEW